MKSTITPASPKDAAYATAQKLAQDAIVEFLVGGGGHWEDRIERLEAVKARFLSAGVDDPRAELHSFIDAHAPNRTDAMHLSDALGTIELNSSTPAYLYGLALGLALGRAGGVR